MKSFTLTVVLAAALLAIVLAEPEPQPAKNSRFRSAQVINNDEGDDDDAVMDGDMDDEGIDMKKTENAAVAGGNKKDETGSGRLFMRQFLLFRNMFGSSSKQPIIPIIITGSSSTTGSSPTTTTITSTGQIPTVSGTITVQPTAAPAPAGDLKQNGQRLQLIARGSYDNAEKNDDDDEDNDEMDAAGNVDEASAIDNEETLAAALAAGAEEYVVTDQEMRGKANRGQAYVNLRRRGSKNGQTVSVRIPPKYRNYFKKGQRVILNNPNRGANKNNKKRRIIRKRVPANRNKKNRRRVVQG